MRAFWHFIRKHKTVFLAGVAVVLQAAFGIELPFPWYVTGPLVYSILQVAIVAKDVVATVDLLEKRVSALEFRMSSWTRSHFHPEDYTAEAFRSYRNWMVTIYQLVDRKGEQRSVKFEDLPQFIAEEIQPGRYNLRTDLEAEEKPMGPGRGKHFEYRTGVLEDATQDEILDYVDRIVAAAPLVGVGDAGSRDRRRNSVLFERHHRS